MVMWEGIPDARLSVLPGCAHGAHLEKPDMFNQVLLDFLDAQRA
jgi:2-hydroxy-6-oxonona-2,4-dienedioate hydrolase